MTEINESSGQRDRSPAYPNVTLGAAIERLIEFDAYFKRSAARPEKVGEAWGIKGKAYVDRTAAALRYFGLLEYQNTGPARQVVVSEEGRKFLRAQQEETKRDVIKTAALRPKQIAKFWELWGRDRPADAACIDELVFKNGFSDNGARDFLKVYDETIIFAQLSNSDIIPLGRDECGAEEDGADQGGPKIQDRPTKDPKAPFTPKETSKEKGILMEGERELTTGLLSKDASFRLIVNGVVGVIEIERLIRKLQLDKEILADQDDAVTVHQFRVWDSARGEYVTQPVKSPADRIARIGGEIVPQTGEAVKRSELNSDGRYNPRGN